MGLLNDLFPKTVELVPRAIDREFEPKASKSNAIIAAAAVGTTITHQKRVSVITCHCTLSFLELTQLCPGDYPVRAKLPKSSLSISVNVVR